MRVLHTADTHLGLRRFGGAYDASADLADTMAAFVKAAEEHEVELAVIAGDLFHGRRPTPDSMLTAIRTIIALDRLGVETIICAGNHDGPRTINDPESHTLAWLEALEMPSVKVLLDDFSGPFGGVWLVSVPYPHKRAYDIELADLPVPERVEIAGQRIRDRLEVLVEKTDGRLILFVGHLTIAGSAIGTEREMQLGWDVTLPASSLKPFDYAALGHVHRQQQIPGTNGWYAGSPNYVSFSEEEEPKAFLLWDDTHGVKAIPSGARPIQTITPRLGDDYSLIEGAIVRARFEGEWEPAQISSYMRDMRSRGAHHVVAVVIPDPRTRQVLEIDADFDVRGLFTRYLDSHELPHEPASTYAQEVIHAVDV